MTSPWIPPVSPTANGFLPNSMKLFWPEKPCQPSVETQAGSTRPLDPPAVSPVGQSADLQYRAPGMRRPVGSEICSTVFAMLPPIVDVPPPGVPSAGPPASYTTCVPVFL